jgi:hypothetical protein
MSVVSSLSIYLFPGAITFTAAPQKKLQNRVRLSLPLPPERAVPGPRPNLPVGVCENCEALAPAGMLVDRWLLVWEMQRYSLHALR